MRYAKFLTVKPAPPRPEPTYDTSMQVYPLVIETGASLARSLRNSVGSRKSTNLWRPHFLETWGVNLPCWRLAENSHLAGCEYRILVRNRLAALGKVVRGCRFLEEVEFLELRAKYRSQRDAPRLSIESRTLHHTTGVPGLWVGHVPKGQLSSLSPEEWIKTHGDSVLEPRLPSLMTLEQTQYEIDLLAAHHPKLMRRVLEKHNIVELRDIFRSLLIQRIPLTQALREFSRVFKP